MHARTPARTHTHAHPHTHTHTLACMHAHTHTRTHTYTYTHTHIHTHTHVHNHNKLPVNVGVLQCVLGHHGFLVVLLTVHGLEKHLLGHILVGCLWKRLKHKKQHQLILSSILLNCNEGILSLLRCCHCQ